MPTRIRPPDLLGRPGQDALTAASAPGEPPGAAGSRLTAGPAVLAGPAGLAGTAGLAAGTAGLAGPAGLAGTAELAAGTAEPAGPVEEPSWAGLRVVTVPDGWPPYDCEAHGAGCPAAASGAGETAMPTAEDTSAANVAPYREATLAVGAASTEPRGTTEPRLAAAWPGQFGQVLVEILAGFRPAKQLAPWTTERVRAQIGLLSCAVAAEQRPRIRRVMTSRPTADVVEMTMVVGFGARSRALAIRFEHVPGRPPTPGRPARPARWICTEIETS